MLFSPAIAHAAGDGISVKLAPYIVGELFGVPITATLITTWLSMAVIILCAFLLTRRLVLIPGKSQSIAEVVIGGIYDYMADVLESRTLAKSYFPIVATIFLFILALNWIGLFPGVTSIGYYNSDSSFIPFLYPAATDLNITVAFAIIAFFTIQLSGVIALGFFKYTSKFINFSSPLKFALGILELFSEITRLVTFSFRLFGNIFAGKTLLVVVIFFVPYILPVPILMFETFVGFIQAFVFAILTLFFIKLAQESPH